MKKEHFKTITIHKCCQLRLQRICSNNLQNTKAHIHSNQNESSMYIKLS